MEINIDRHASAIVRVFNINLGGMRLKLLGIDFNCYCKILLFGSTLILVLI